jgi:hypothetical protein
MEEPTNEYDGPNPLEQLAEKVRILVEKGEFPLAVEKLTQPGVEKLRKFARGSQPKPSQRQAPDRIGRIERAILKNPAWSDHDLAKLLRVGKASVWRTRRDMNGGAR